MTNGQQDYWWKTVYVNRSSSTTVSSIICGHNKQTAVQVDVLLPPSCAWGEERLLPRTSAPRGGGELQSRDNTTVCKKSARWGLVLHLLDQQIRKCLPPLAQVGSSLRPRLALPQLHLPPHLAWLTSVGCYLPGGL